MDKPIGKTPDGYEVYAIELTGDRQSVRAIAIRWPGEPEMLGCFCSKLYDGAVMIELNDPTDGDHLTNPWYGDRGALGFGGVGSPEPPEMTPEEASPFLREIAEKAFVSEGSAVWDYVAGRCYDAADLGDAKFLYVRHDGLVGGPGSEGGDIEFSMTTGNPRVALFPVLSAMFGADLDAAEDLVNALRGGEPRRIAFGNRELENHFDAESSPQGDAWLWLQCLDGDPHPGAAEAAKETADLIREWMDVAEALLQARDALYAAADELKEILAKARGSIRARDAAKWAAEIRFYLQEDRPDRGCYVSLECDEDGVLRADSEGFFSGEAQVVLPDFEELSHTAIAVGLSAGGALATSLEAQIFRT